jgi:hypothetical protein
MRGDGVITLLLRAGMVASRLVPVERAIPALVGAERNSKKLWPDRAEILPSVVSKPINVTAAPIVFGLMHGDIHRNPPRLVAHGRMMRCGIT